MHPDESLNPYAAAKAQLVNPDTNGPVSPRRPVSAKWATFTMGVFTLLLGVTCWKAIQEQGIEKIWQEQSLFDRVFLPPLGLLLGLFGGRRKVVYYVMSVILAVMVFRGGLYVLMRCTFPGAFVGVALVARVLEALMFYAFWMLFYRFTLGLPSRRYFGLAREEGLAERQA